MGKKKLDRNRCKCVCVLQLKHFDGNEIIFTPIVGNEIIIRRLAVMWLTVVNG